MNSRFRLIESKPSGFTLPELMISIAIMGLLISMSSSVYSSFLGRTRASQASSLLSGVALSEQTFFDEYGSYTSCLEATGYSFTGGDLYYAIGFSDGPFSTCGNGTQDCDGSDWAGTNSCSTPTVGSLGAPAASWWTATSGVGSPAGCTDTTCGSVVPTDLPASTVSNVAFLIYASGRVSNIGILDVWNINNSNALKHTQVGY